MPVRLHTATVAAALLCALVMCACSDGQDIARGQMLFEIDARPLQAQWQQAQAAMARDQAQLARARTG